MAAANPKLIYVSVVPLTVWVAANILWLGASAAGLFQFSLAWLFSLVFGIAFFAALIVLLEGALRWIPAIGFVLFCIWLMNWYFRDLLQVKDRKIFSEMLAEHNKTRNTGSPPVR